MSRRARASRRPPRGVAPGSYGHNFQYDVAALLAAHVLHRSVPEAFDLPEATRLVDLHHETPAEVDDIVAKTSDGGWIFVQAKGGKVEASGALARPLGKAASQFVRQFIVCAQKRGEDVFDTRPLDERDRLVVACDAQASQRVGVDLSRALQVLRSEGEDSPRYRDLSERCTRALDRLKGLVREAYKQATQQALSPADELQILRLVRIWWLPQGADEVAKHLLRQVIADPPRAPDAWSALHELAGQKSAARGSLDDRTLRQYLQDRGISLQGEVDHRLAQDALARASDRARGNLARHAHIQLADRELKIDREVLEPALAAARSRSLLIVGAPGEGKSGLLHAIGTALGDEGREVIFLEADAPLQVLESRLGAYLVDVLSGWRGSAAPVLLIDALDACREPQARYEWRRLIGSLPSTLAPPTIVATIRVFDLRYDVALRALFPGKPVLGESREPLLSSVRHLWMQPLSEQELSAVADRWRPLREFLGACSPELRQLVRTPFHLRILCDLLDRGQDDASTLRGIASEVQLLDRYWDWRVDSDDSGRQQADHAGCRMRTLASLGSTMVKQQRLKLEDTGEADPEAISELLRAGLLMREENTLSFAHHLLADYAFERVVLGKDAEALASQLLERRADCIFLATSLRLRLERWWIERRNEYWRLVEALAEREALSPSLAVFVLRAAAEFTREREDLTPLLAALERLDQPSAHRVLKWLRVALAARQIEGAKIVGSEDAPWDIFIADAAKRHDLALDLVRMLDLLRRDAGAATQPEREARVRAARALLDATEHPWARRVLLAELAGGLAHFPESRGCLERCLEPASIERFRHADLEVLAEFAVAIAGAAPDLARRLYEAAFRFRADRDAVVSGGSATLRLSMSVRDIHQHVLSRLEEAFPALIEASWLEATRALIGAVAARYETAPEVLRFRLRGRDGWIAEDRSSLDIEPWPTQSDSGEPPYRMILTYVDAWIDRGAQATDGTVDETLDLFVEHCHSAVLWDHLLRAGSRDPDRIGRCLTDFVKSRAILEGHGLRRIVDWGRAVFSRLDEPERRSIEEEILAVRHESDGREFLRPHARDLLSGVNRSDLALAETRLLRDSLGLSDAVAEDRPVVRLEYQTGDWLRERQVDPASELHAPVLQAARIVEQASLPPRGEAPTDVTALIMAIGSLETALAEHRGIDPHVDAHVQSILLRGWSRVLDSSRETTLDETVKRARSAFLKARDHASPLHAPEEERTYERGPSHGGADVRVFAAHGLVQIAALRFADSDVVDALKTLAGDPAPAVRGRIAQGLGRLPRDTAMELAMRFLQQEENRAVLRFLTADGLPALLFNHDPELLADLLARLLERFPRTPGNEDLRSSALARVVDLHLFRAVPRALRLIDDALEHIQDDPNTALQLVLLRRGILIWQTDAVARSAAEIRRAALELMQRACQKVSPLLRALEDRHRSTHDEGERGTIRDQWEQLHRILGSIVLETTHATDGDSLRSTLGEAASQTYKTVRSKFWEEAHDLLDVLATAPLDAHDVDRLLSTLSSYSDSDPLRVLTLLRAVLGRARETGFLDDRFGGPRLLELCQRLIVGHPELFVTDGPQASILDLLDALVEAEWPEAEVLAARLQDVWR